jgi:hypothetical protein
MNGSPSAEETLDTPSEPPASRRVESPLSAVLERSRLLVAIAPLSLAGLAAVATVWDAARSVEFVTLLVGDDEWKAGKTLAPLLADPGHFSCRGSAARRGLGSGGALRW